MENSYIAVFAIAVDCFALAQFLFARHTKLPFRHPLPKLFSPVGNGRAFSCPRDTPGGGALGVRRLSVAFPATVSSVRRLKKHRPVPSSGSGNVSDGKGPWRI
jgi:hypothetical protein